MTVRDGARYLAQSLASLSTQTFDAWELVLWDDGSSDDTLAIARAYAAQDARICVFEGGPRGRRDALIAAHVEARGAYLAWLDADDWLAPTALARSYEVLVETGCDLVYTDHIIIDADGAEHGLGRRSQLPYSAHALLLDFMTFHFRLFTRDVFERAGSIDRQFEIAIDYDLCLRISEHGRIRQLAEPLYFYRRHASQLSAQHRDNQIAASERAIRAALERRGLDAYELLAGREAARLRLRPIVEPACHSVGEWLRIGLATVAPRFRVSRESSRVRVVGTWPVRAPSAYRTQLVSACDARGIHMSPIDDSLSALMRAVWSGRAGDALHVLDLAPLFQATERGSILANCRMFIATIDHARARGMRVMWTQRGPVATHSRCANDAYWCHSALADRCDVIVTHWPTDAARFARSTYLPHPSLEDAYPVVRHAAPVGEVVVEEALDALSPREVARRFAAAEIVLFSSVDSVTATSIAIAMSLQRPIVAPSLPGLAEILPNCAVLYDVSGGEEAIAAAVASARVARTEWPRQVCENLARVRATTWDAVVTVLVGR